MQPCWFGFFPHSQPWSKSLDYSWLSHVLLDLTCIKAKASHNSHKQNISKNSSKFGCSFNVLLFSIKKSAHFFEKWYNIIYVRAT